MTEQQTQSAATDQPLQSRRPLKVALLGAGNVGAEVARQLLDHGTELAKRSGAGIELKGIAVRNVEAPRTVDLPADLFTTDASGLIEGADIVVELLGGIEPARTLISQALRGGASVVTGNKALLAQHGPELYAIAAESNVQLSFEASVAGAIPILRPIRDSLSGDRVTRVLGIVNGTTNYILDQMDTTGASFDSALRQAQELGFAEADPTADVDGHDAAAKAAILSSLAFHGAFAIEDVYCEGIRQVTADDIQAAAESGLVIKLLAIAERVSVGDSGEAFSVRVHPTLVPRSHPLASVHGAFNAVFIQAELAGELMFYGQGAGGAPTASAVLGDVVSAARRIVLGGPGRTEQAEHPLPAAPIGAVLTRYCVGIDVRDQPGVLAVIAQSLAERGVSIETMRQSLDTNGEPSAYIRIVTHQASEEALSQTIKNIRELSVVRQISSVLRVEGTH